jgi:hypothetical protein
MQVSTIDSPPSTKIHLIGGEKGGVGKSMVSRLLAQYFIDHDLPFIGFDTDRSHGALLRFYADYASPVLIDRYEALDEIVEIAVEQQGRRVLVDLAAQTDAPLVKWLDDSGVLDMQASGFFTRFGRLAGPPAGPLWRARELRAGAQSAARRRFQPARKVRPARARAGHGRKSRFPQAPARCRRAEDRCA